MMIGELSLSDLPLPPPPPAPHGTQKQAIILVAFIAIATLAVSSLIMFWRWKTSETDLAIVYQTSVLTAKPTVQATTEFEITGEYAYWLLYVDYGDRYSNPFNYKESTLSITVRNASGSEVVTLQLESPFVTGGAATSNPLYYRGTFYLEVNATNMQAGRTWQFQLQVRAKPV